MNHPVRLAFRHCLAVLIVAASLGVASHATAEIFKCKEKSGLDRYQNFPCAIDSQGWLPSERTATKPAAGGATPEGLKNAPPVVATSAKPARANEPRVGMTADEVRAIWGEPVETDQDERKEGRIDIWRYADGRSVEFNHKQRALTVQR